MKRIAVTALGLVALLATVVCAQRPASDKQWRAKPVPAAEAPSDGPSDWYSRPSTHLMPDPATSVRLKAAYRAQQRMARISAMKWFGMSNSRPVASATPWSGVYSPMWTSNSRRPYAWSGAGR